MLSIVQMLMLSPGIGGSKLCTSATMPILTEPPAVGVSCAIASRTAGRQPLNPVVPARASAAPPKPAWSMRRRVARHSAHCRAASWCIAGSLLVARRIDLPVTWLTLLPPVAETVVHPTVVVASGTPARPDLDGSLPQTGHDALWASSTMHMEPAASPPDARPLF